MPPAVQRKAHICHNLPNGWDDPAFIAQQLGHSVQMLLITYAHWIDGGGDWAALERLKFAPKMPQA